MNDSACSENPPHVSVPGCAGWLVQKQTRTLNQLGELEMPGRCIRLVHTALLPKHAAFHMSKSRKSHMFPWTCCTPCTHTAGPRVSYKSGMFFCKQKGGELVFSLHVSGTLCHCEFSLSKCARRRPGETERNVFSQLVIRYSRRLSCGFRTFWPVGP